MFPDQIQKWVIFGYPNLINMDHLDSNYVDFRIRYLLMGSGLFGVGSDPLTGLVFKHVYFN